MTVDYLFTILPDDTELQLFVVTPHGAMISDGYITVEDLKKKDDDDRFYLNFLNNEVVCASA